MSPRPTDDFPNVTQWTLLPLALNIEPGKLSAATQTNKNIEYVHPCEWMVKV